MLVGAFEEPYIQYALESIKWIDEIVFVYNNICDKNKQSINDWLPRYKGLVKVVDYWDYYTHYENSECIDFALARNIGKYESTGDYILKIDADEVYYNSFEKTVRSLSYIYEVYKVDFIHMFYDFQHFRFIQDKEVLYKRSDDIHWESPVHEYLWGWRGEQYNLPDRFMHLGYIKPPAEVFKKWLLYAALENEPTRYGDIDPNCILDGVQVREWKGEYPEALKPLFKKVH